MSDVVMEMTPRQSYLNFILSRAEFFHSVMADPTAKDTAVEYAITTLIAMTPDKFARKELFREYFSNLKKMNVRTAALISCGSVCSSLCISLDIVETATGSFA